MSLLKWQEMAKSKSALGKKINFVHNAITQKKLGEETSQIGFEKMFKPVTSKLDEVIASNLGPQGSLRSLPRAKPARKKKAKLEGIDYFPDVDPFEDMDVEGLFDETAPVPPKPRSKFQRQHLKALLQHMKKLWKIQKMVHRLNMKKMTLSKICRQLVKLKKQMNYSPS